MILMVLASSTIANSTISNGTMSTATVTPQLSNLATG
jgi:hypothetical protein